VKILFILPGIGKKPGERYLKSWLMEPLTIAVLKRLTPSQHETAFFDDRIETIDYEADCDVVAITTETYTAQRAYAIADRFKARGKVVIAGGYHATLCPQDIAAHTDIVVTGNAESVWASVLADVEKGQYKPRYHGETRLDYGLPDRSIYAAKMHKYLPIALVEVGRGCRHRCEFCSIHSYYRGHYEHRPVADIVAEIKSCKHRLFFLVDDSILSDRHFARELFTEIAKLHITWVTQVTLDVARDDDLLRLMRASGCLVILIGFESMNVANLQLMNKSWNAKMGGQDDLVERIHRAGISIYASFVFGFDSDCEQTFDEVLEFCRRHRFFVAAFNHLLVFPDTGTHARLSAEGRLSDDRWWLEDGYEYGTVVFRPTLLEPGQITGYCRRNKTRFYAFASIVRRAPAQIVRTRSALLVLAYWYINVLFHFEVDKRLGIPIGANLDEASR